MLSDEAIANLTRVFGDNQAAYVQSLITDTLSDDTINEINKRLTTGDLANTDLTEAKLLANSAMAISPTVTLDSVLALIQYGRITPEATTEQISEFLDQRELDPRTQSIRSLTAPTFGTFDPTKSRYANLFNTATEANLQAVLDDPLYGLVDGYDEWFIKEEVDELIAQLPQRERELISIELADFFGSGMDQIYKADGTFNEYFFRMQMTNAYAVMDSFKPTFPVYENDDVNIAGQSGLGISTVFDIAAGQSGRTVAEIEELFDIGIAESAKQAGYKDYDPVYLMDTVNNKAGQVLGVELSEQQKQAFVRLMKDTVDAHFTGGLQMPMVDAQAKKFVQEEFPQRTLAEAQGSTIRAIEAAVRNM